MGFFSTVKKVIGTVVPIVKKVGSFVAKYHSPITQLAHGAAMASGNQKLQKVTGGIMAASQMATMRQGLNAQNAKVASAMAANGGRPGIYNADTGVLR
jgi:hypothetical protein